MSITTKQALAHLTKVWESYDCKPKDENNRSTCCDAECIIVLKTDDWAIESCSKCLNMVENK
jgi:hypothetical protein